MYYVKSNLPCWLSWRNLWNRFFFAAGWTFRECVPLYPARRTILIRVPNFIYPATRPISGRCERLLLRTWIVLTLPMLLIGFRVFVCWPELYYTLWWIHAVFLLLRSSLLLTDSNKEKTPLGVIVSLISVFYHNEWRCYISIVLCLSRKTVIRCRAMELVSTFMTKSPSVTFQHIFVNCR